ncbi:SH3 domain-containing protein [Streptomyces sp. O3]
MTTWDFRPTHVVHPDGLPSWAGPDASRPSEPLDALLPVRLLERRGDWGRVECANGWSTWVDARLLVSVPRRPPDAAEPLGRVEDPRPLLARAAAALREYCGAAAELARGRADGEAFRRRTRGLRVGVVVDGESVWLYDAEQGRWCYCDGSRLTGFAADAGPDLDPEPGRGEADGVAAGAADAVGAADADAAEDVDGAAEGVDGAAEGVGHEPTRVVEPSLLRAADEPDGSDAQDDPGTPGAPGAPGGGSGAVGPPGGPASGGDR